MTRSPLDLFAETLMRVVRDRSISAVDQLVHGAGGPQGEFWREALGEAAYSESVLKLVPDIVDRVLFELLNAVDNGEFPIAWADRNGSAVALEELGSGETAGWLMASDGWRRRFSETRSNDYFSDLHLRAD